VTQVAEAQRALQQYAERLAILHEIDRAIIAQRPPPRSRRTVLRSAVSPPRHSVVVMTSSREERDLIESYRLGVNSYIVKPVDFQQFGEAVRQVGLYWVLLNQPPASLGG
jgi:DNA-binding NarL/FixJ family response regulator